MVMARLAAHVKLACEVKSRFLEHRERNDLCFARYKIVVTIGEAFDYGDQQER
jgi:hypothetical protein